MALTKIRGETVTLAAARAFATVRGIPPGFDVLEIEAPSATIESITVGFGPRIGRVYFYDASAAVGTRWRDVTAAAVDRNTAVLIDVSEMQTDDRLYIGAVRRSEGLAVDVTGTNGAGTASGVYEYPNGLTWTDLSATDGTRNTAVFDQDGLVTWTVPTSGGWTPRDLRDVSGEGEAAPSTDPLYWIRMRPDAALTDTAITLAQITALMNNALNAATNDNEGQDLVRITSSNGGKPPYRFVLDTNLYGGVELVSASITSAANLNWLQER